MSYIMPEIQTSVTEAEALALIERIAKFIVERQLAPAGILLIESLRPLHGIGSQFLFFILPVAEFIFDSKKYQQFALMLENEKYVKLLIDRIDELDEQYNHERREKARLMRKRRKAQIKAFFNRLLNRNKKSD